MSTCNHDCKNCASQCNQSTLATNVNSNIKNVIAVVSGKGGVGKSLVTSMLAVYSQRAGYKTAVLSTDDERIAALSLYYSLGFRPVYEHESHTERWESVLKKIKQ